MICLSAMKEDEAAPLPEDFDAAAYLERYPDVAASSFGTLAGAAVHYRQFGRAEGRWATRASYPTRRALACPSIHSLYLRATGDLVCWDDAGNDTVLQAFDPAVDYARDVFLGPVFNRLRHELVAGRLPHSEVCRRCLVLRGGVVHSSFHLDRRVIEIFQLEPSYKCTLDCPGCVPLAVRRGAPPRELDLAVIDKILTDLVAGGVTVRAFDLQGHGEPLLHPRLGDLVGLVRRHYPESYMTMTTNAHGVVKESLVRCGLDEVICSIDGIDAPSYEPYRVRGRYGLAESFLAALCKAKARAPRPLKVIWKYILFAHNDRPDQLATAQRRARELGVDELVFVFTRNGPRSLRLHGPEALPAPLSGLAQSHRFHEPDLADLTGRLEEAERQRENGEAGVARDLAASVIANLDRFGLLVEEAALRSRAASVLRPQGTEQVAPALAPEVSRTVTVTQ
jgi:hypothetical protein